LIIQSEGSWKRETIFIYMAYLYICMNSHRGTYKHIYTYVCMNIHHKKNRRPHRGAAVTGRLYMFGTHACISLIIQIYIHVSDEDAFMLPLYMHIHMYTCIYIYIYMDKFIIPKCIATFRLYKESWQRKSLACCRFLHIHTFIHM